MMWRSLLPARAVVRSAPRSHLRLTAYSRAVSTSLPSQTASVGEAVGTATEAMPPGELATAIQQMKTVPVPILVGPAPLTDVSLPAGALDTTFVAIDAIGRAASASV